MTFVSIHQLLKWYFNKKWLKPPKMPGNHDPNYTPGGRFSPDPEKVFTAAQKIKEALYEIPIYDRSFLEKLFTGMDTDEAATLYNVSERRIRQRRQILIQKLSVICTKEGLFGKPIYDEPVFKRQESYD